MLYALALVPVLVVLPFVALIRGAVYLYATTHLTTGLALAGAAIAAGTVLTAYGVWVVRRITGAAPVRTIALRIVTPLVVAYCAYALLFLARVNAKTDDIRAVYRETHPLLRLAASTLILIDDDAVITDLGRTPDDYERMGLPTAERSLHYRQPDGWVHALDLRTLGRGPLRNWLVAGYFRALGFRTLRHVGTADHLHVSLPLPAMH